MSRIKIFVGFFLLATILISCNLATTDNLIQTVQTESAASSDKNSEGIAIRSADNKSDDDFSIALLPDTQKYTINSYKIYEKQTKWIAKNKNNMNIKFVIHLGDVTENNKEKEWEIASDAHKYLEGIKNLEGSEKIPYSITTGNHDYKPTDDIFLRKSKFSKYFGKSRFQGNGAYGGSYSSENINNFSELTISSDLKLLILSLEFNPRKDVIKWANNVINKYPYHKVIVVTHNYIQNGGSFAIDDKTKWGDKYNLIGLEPENLTEEFIKIHSNIFLVLCGHECGSEVKTITGNNGNKINIILTDFQGLNNLGNGWLRVLKFRLSTKENKIEITNKLAISPNDAIYDKLFNSNPVDPYPEADIAGIRSSLLNGKKNKVIRTSNQFHDFSVNAGLPKEQKDPAIACDKEGNFVVVWEDDHDNNGTYQIYASGFTAYGEKKFNIWPVNNNSKGQQQNPDIAMADDGDFIIVWEDDRSKNGKQIYANRYKSDGTSIGSNFMVHKNSEGEKLHPRVDINNKKNYVVAWQDDRDGNKYYEIKAKGNNLLTNKNFFSEQTINKISSGQQRQPDVSINNKNQFIVVFEDDNDKNKYYEIYGRFFDGTKLSKEGRTINHIDTGDQLKPRVALEDNGNFMVVWEDLPSKSNNEEKDTRVLARSFNSFNSPKKGFNVTSYLQKHAYPKIETKNGKYTIVWHDDEDSNNYMEIKAIQYDINGKILKRKHTVNSDSSGQQYYPDIAVSDDCYYITWQDNVDKNSYYEILVRSMK